MRKSILIGSLLFFVSLVNGQELYVFTEPASNIPAHAISIKLTDHFVTSDKIYDRFSHRLMPQVLFGISKKIMFQIGGTLGNMHTPDFRFESVNFYAKYRFLSNDAVHKHFRMAVFADASATNAPFHYDEITLMGDKSGIEAGLIATQLWNKFALSGTISHTEVLDKSRNNKVIYVPARAYQSMNYSLSGGYLLFPKEYTDYKQTNVNLYAELLTEQLLDINKYYIDLAPAVQFIFNSNAKLNIGYRFQVSGTMQRMSTSSWQLSFERTFLNAMKKRT
ncbi:MAG: hypothetical protein IPO53_01525 [Chitinophagaceae bacterium]|nr:hypothetical protein [Chitinophagaceae bacterium]